MQLNMLFKVEMFTQLFYCYEMPCSLYYLGKNPETIKSTLSLSSCKRIGNIITAKYIMKDEQGSITNKCLQSHCFESLTIQMNYNRQPIVMIETGKGQPRDQCGLGCVFKNIVSQTWSVSLLLYHQRFSVSLKKQYSLSILFYI